jgi:transcriptional regulator with XRE-family HTH domain
MTSPLNKYRTDRDLSLKQVGVLLDVNKSTILRWEKAGVPVERLEDVSKALGIPPQVLRPDFHRLFAKSGRAA